MKKVEEYDLLRFLASQAFAWPQVEREGRNPALSSALAKPVSQDLNPG
jgi:hypothetical protein